MDSINKLTIIGVGLIGGSLARALKQKNWCQHVSGCSRNAANLEKAVALGVIDDYSTDPASAVQDADVVLLASPVSTYAAILEQIEPALNAAAVITDAGSTKGSVVAAARATLGDALPRFVPGHPIAGTEKSGVQASLADLYENHRVILTPLPETTDSATQLITAMWQVCGAEVITMTHEHHDSVLAATSHLPHLLAYALVDCLAGKDEREEIFRYAAGGFADFTRIASSSPGMWHDICFSNRQQLLQAVEAFEQHLRDIEQAIKNDDSDGLLEIFTRAKLARDRFTDLRKPGKQND
ncbi:MAG: prephenate dehydrogenase/arogenate dehydrogenase family protein [Thiotrichales bacterium]|nr:prephenate dehydrogenase/arogenate dehydrogenase family protein [Thiotrichales bacterium]